VMVSSDENLPAAVGLNLIFTRLDLSCENVNGPVPVDENGEPGGPPMLPSRTPLPWLAIFTAALA
jgi:hypothetical protein